jgi:hypothetical protein
MFYDHKCWQKYARVPNYETKPEIHDKDRLIRQTPTQSMTIHSMLSAS